MKKYLLIILTAIISIYSYSQKEYKSMIDDLSINFYDVCKEADKYFETHDKSIKDSGWKGYQRWKTANEYKYYPDGIRNQTDPYFTINAYNDFLKNNNQTKLKSSFENGWNELGTVTIDSLTGHYSPGLGRIEDFYVNPSNANLMYVGSRSGGFWRTTNGGTNWTVTTDFMLASGVNAIAVSPTNKDSVLINLRNSNNGTSHGIYRSLDGGLTWSESNFNPTTLSTGGLGTSFKIYTIKYHHSIPNLVFIGTNQGLYRSDDNLATWTRLYNYSNIKEIEFHPTNNNIIYIYDSYLNSNKNYILKSIDTGLSYIKTNLIVGNNSNTNVRLSVSNACSNCLFFASTNGVWKSTDIGENFTFLNNPNQDCRGFAVNDTDENNMVYGYVDIEASTNGGNTFSQVTAWSFGNALHGSGSFTYKFHNSTHYVHADLRKAKCINGIFYVGTDGFFAKSDDNGLNWEKLGQGIAVKENYKIGVSQSNGYESISGSQDNGESIRFENRWLEFYGADGMEGIIHPLNNDWIIGSSQRGGRRRTKDSGLSQGGATPTGSESGAWEAPLAYAPDKQMTIYDFRENVYKSDDFGSNWTMVGSPNFGGTIKQAAIAENNSDIIIVSSFGAIEKSLNGGVSFTSIDNSLPNYFIEDIAFDPKNDDVIIVVFARYQADNKKVYITHNGGTSWSNITYNLGNMPIHSVVIDHSNQSVIYLGAEIGIYTKPMNSNTWTLYNPNLPNVTVEELEIVYGTNTLKAATWGRGVWEYTLVGRNDFPSIMRTRITHNPTDIVPQETKEQFVYSTIEYDNTLNSVFVKWSLNSPVLNNTINMTNTSANNWKSDTAIPEQVAGTKVYFKVFAVGSNNDTTETYRFNYIVKPFEYCDASGSMNFDGNITLVDLKEINKATGKIAAYNNYLDTDSAYLYKGQNYNVSVNLRTDNGNVKYYAKVWIDWNINAIFEDNEAYELGYSENTLDGITNLSPFNFTVPTDAETGQTIMRVFCKFNSYPSACDENIDGEVEDYRINIIAAPKLDIETNNVICKGDYYHFNYIGDAVDSIEWTILNSSSSIHNSDLEIDSVIINNSGTYNLELKAYFDNEVFIKDSSNVFQVNNINTNVSTSSSSILADANGMSYTWLDCNNQMAIIQGENSQIFNATENGTYAVELFDGTCSEVSECIIISNVSIKNNEEFVLKIYPNPAKSKIIIELDKFYSNMYLSIQNNLGQKVFRKNKFSNKKIEIDLNHFAKGVYFINIQTNEKIASYKFIKQ